MGEFDLIERYFKRPAKRALLGMGDDCALLQAPAGTHMAISSDMLVEGRHFFADVDPRTLGHKALAVNLSDLAACGAEPLAFTLALALPKIDEVWLAGFSQGLFALADQHGCELIGGDTTRGPLNICITVFGTLPAPAGKSQALLRSGAQPGDDIYVSGQLGDARLALDALRGRFELPPALLQAAMRRLEAPSPRIALGLALRGLASAAMDLSDGLVGDLQHLLKASQVGATLHTAAALSLLAARTHVDWPRAGISDDAALSCVLSGGDDYELLFTAPPSAAAALQAAALQSATPIHCIGRINAAPGLQLLDDHGRALAMHFTSFDHFS
ncbi:MAG: thiamine-phosphate kinase [Polaromonas sp.]|jgi:thiamine-monophosphate kinase